MRKPADCLPCSAGSYCGGTGGSAPTGKCDAGYFCTGAVGTATIGAQSAQEAVTPKGSYTPAGSAAAIRCPPGSYAKAETQPACDLCDAGTSCSTPGLSAGTPCTAGVYCPLGAVHPRTCLAGTYQPEASAAASGACLPCSVGKVCASEGLAVTGEACEAGYICWRRAFTTTPARVLGAQTAGCEVATGAGQATCSCWSEDFGLCPPGHHCGSGAACPTACPAGTVQPAVGAIDATACLTCPAGSYCGAAGQAQPSGACPGGYFCVAGSEAAAAAGTACPRGHRCPAQIPDKVKCPPGSYQPEAGKETCT